MEIDLSEILPPLRDQFTSFDCALNYERQTTFAWIDPGSLNPKMIGFLRSNLIPGDLLTADDPNPSEWTGAEVVEKGAGGAGVFWMCPVIPQFALIRLQMAEKIGGVSWGRRLQGAVRSEGDFTLFSTHYLPGEMQDACTGFSLCAGDYEVFVDEHFHWPVSDFLDVRNDQILFTVTFVPSERIQEFSSAKLIPS